MDSSTRFSLRDRSCLPCSPYSPGWAGLAWDGAALVITRSQRAAPDGSLVRARRGAQTFSHLRVSARSAGVHYVLIRRSALEILRRIRTAMRLTQQRGAGRPRHRRIIVIAPHLPAAEDHDGAHALAYVVRRKPSVNADRTCPD